MTEIKRSRTLLVVCPTEYGGQIEHAAEFAAAGSRTGIFSRVILVSRPGARESTRAWTDSFSLIESLLPRRTSRSPLRQVQQLVDLWRERMRLRRLINSLCSTSELTILWETGKYGLPTRDAGVRNVLFLHNAVPHEVHNMTIRDRIFFASERRMTRRATLTAVHGKEQRVLVEAWRPRQIVVVPLPGDTRTVTATEPISGALCIGEVRPNKGLETAILAAQKTDTRLRVIGSPEPPSYGQGLLHAFPATTTDFDFRYLDAEEFNGILASAQVVLLPYIHFAAQSGVLAKAMQYRRRIIASDLTSLREQAGDYPMIEFVEPGDVEALADQLLSVPADEGHEATDSLSDAEREWDEVARSVFS